VGGPCSGKKEAAQMIQEEFGYRYISTGEILRKEILKGNKEGDRVRKLMQDGAIIPYETVVHCLIAEMVSNKSQNYVLDGFPRSVDQAQYFEQSAGEL
jgi:adenylate kinase family enzyme